MQKKLNTGTGELNRRITLLNLIPAPGSAQPREKDKHTVWADLFLAGISTQYSAEAVGKRVEYNAVVWKNAYQGETHAIYENQRLKIDKVAPAHREDMLKLILVRE